MTNYKLVLVAVDFSQESRRVLDKAMEVARLNNAGLSLIHVVEYTGSVYAGDIPLPEDLELDQRLAKQAKEQLMELAAEHQLTDTHQIVEIGIPKKEIVRAAQQQGADLIVIGSHGRHGLQLLLGSTANGVLHLATCDVLAVRVGKK